MAHRVFGAPFFVLKNWCFYFYCFCFHDAILCAVFRMWIGSGCQFRVGRDSGLAAPGAKCEVCVMSISSDLLAKLATASPDVLARVGDVLDGRSVAPSCAEIDIGSLTLTEAARRSNLSTPTLRRLIDDGRIAAVRLGGCRRIVHRSLVDFMLGDYNRLKGKRNRPVPVC